MSAGDNGGPAFPQINQWDRDRMTMGPSGMTLRDYFAAKAMQSLIIASISNQSSPVAFDDRIFSFAYAYADRMIEERTKDGT